MYAATGHTGITPIPSSACIVPIATAIPFSEIKERSPLLASVPPPKEESAKRLLKGKYPLVRQQSAPTFNQRPKDLNLTQTRNEAVHFSDAPASPGVEVELRKKKPLGDDFSRPNSSEIARRTITPLDPEDTAKAFRKALRSSNTGFYKRVHYPLQFPISFIQQMFACNNFPLPSLEICDINEFTITVHFKITFYI